MTTTKKNEASEPHSLVMSAIDKRFPGVQALSKADLSVQPGEIHGLVGENGAGKSTIIKVLAGVYAHDDGKVFINGQEVKEVTPQTVHEQGVRFIHQELHLVPYFTVAESIFLGQELRTRWMGIDRKEMCKRAEAFLLKSLNADLDSHRLIRDLTVAERKLVQIARALIDEQAKMVVFDEPTAPLASDEIEQVFKAIRRLKKQGISMIYVSHYLGEITEICDRVTVFRNGKNVAVLEDVGPEHADRMIECMVGREIRELYPEKRHRVGDPRLIARNLGDGEKFRDISFELGAGEVVGVAGLVGSGREELIDSLYGLRQMPEGSLIFDNEDVRLSSPVKAVGKGIVLVPRDRRNDGLVLEMSVSDNINLASLADVAVVGFERRQAALQRAE
ncbi:MAG: sugar ABC transporter ATP-binding protein, partial [Deltaproteobacteria bacterium]|nr:sugar ABC transporter ATP-binding protein [Deltaproteobacteria bacterium]